MFKKSLLLTVFASLLTVGCATTQTPDAVTIPAVKYDRLVVIAPLANIKVVKTNPYSQAMVKLTPAKTTSDTN